MALPSFYYARGLILATLTQPRPYPRPARPLEFVFRMTLHEGWVSPATRHPVGTWTEDFTVVPTRVDTLAWDDRVIVCRGFKKSHVNPSQPYLY
jgi:hypothetical protein